MKNKLRIGTRGSRLALAQTGMIRAALSQLYPAIDFQIEIIKTTGDKLKTAPLTLIGGQGVFTKELQDALLDNRIDIAVHSLKDLPTITPERLTLAAIPERENPCDALLLPLHKKPEIALSPDTHHHQATQHQATRNLQSPVSLLPPAAIVGTSSLRRATQLKIACPGLRIKELRGNVDTRIAKLDAGEYDAIVLAAAGLNRLGLSARINAIFDYQIMLPAIGQGALGLETRADDTDALEVCQPLDHAETRTACLAERSLLRALGGGCQLPIAGHSLIYNSSLQLHGFISDTRGANHLRAAHEGTIDEAEQTGAQLAAIMLERGAAAFLSPVIL